MVRSYDSEEVVPMNRGASISGLAFGVMLSVVGCSQKLDGSTWKGQFERDTVTFEFGAGDKVKCTWTKGFGDHPISTSSDMTYSIDGNTILFKASKVTGKATLEGNQMIATPVDLGFENLDSKARVVVKRQ
jgi:hypothetical protein